MTPHRVRLTMRYTRISCMPMRATMDLDRVVSAEDQDDAVRQACLCLDRDLEELLWAVNSMNVSEVIVEVRSVEPAAEGDREAPWNPDPFPAEVTVPPYVILQRP